MVFQGRYVRTELQTVVLPDGTKATREIVSPPDAVGILPMDRDSRVYLVRQYRPAIRKITVEIPAGVIDPGEDALQTAERECREEIQMRPASLTPLCSFYHSVGFSTGKITVVLAQDLEPVDEAHSEPGEFLEVLSMPFDALLEQVLTGAIVDSKTIIGALWYQQMRLNTESKGE